MKQDDTTGDEYGSTSSPQKAYQQKIIYL